MAEQSRTGRSLPEIQQIAAFCGDLFGLDAYLRATWHYVPDPVQFEFVRSPEFQVMTAPAVGFFEGDCDDAATFGGAIALALGYFSRFTAYRLPGRELFSHVNLRCLLLDGRLMDIDPTVNPSQLPILGAAEVLEVTL
jgi:hypothetical protein